MSVSEFKKFFNLDKKFELQKINNDKNLMFYLKKSKRSFIGLGVFSIFFISTFASSSYDNYKKIRNFLVLKFNIYLFRSKLFTSKINKINHLCSLLNEKVNSF